MPSSDKAYTVKADTQFAMKVIQEMDRLKPVIAFVLRQLDHTHDHVALRALVLAGEAQFWPAPRSFVITELIQYPVRKVCRISVAGGSRRELTAMHDSLLAFAAREGCETIEIVGRPGWLRQFGAPWKQTAVILSRPVEVSDGRFLSRQSAKDNKPVRHDTMGADAAIPVGGGIVGAEPVQPGTA